MTTLETNNQNKTKFNFSFNNELPYKKSIRPEMEYGLWIKRPEKTLLKVTLSDRDYNSFKNPHDINGIGTYIVGKEIYFDLDDVYLIIAYDKQIERKVKEKNFIIAFYYNEKLISALGK